MNGFFRARAMAWISLLSLVSVLTVGCANSGASAVETPETRPVPNPAPKIFRLGYLHEGAEGDEVDVAQLSFLEGLQDLGYMEGKNIEIEYRYTEGRADLARLHARELVNEAVDAIVATGSIRVQAAIEATSTIPIIMTNAADPVEAGFVESLARPGTNVTGLSTQSPRLSALRVDYLQRMAPRTSKVAVLYNPDNPGSARGLSETDEGAADKGLATSHFPVRNRTELRLALDSALEAGSDAVIALGDAIFFTNRRDIAQFGLDHRIPTTYNLEGFAAAGGLFAYGANFPALYRSAAGYVDQIVKGMDPAEISVAQPTTFDFTINVVTAQAIGLELSPEILAQATRVIR